MNSNLQGNYETLECEACGGDDETQEHILVCKVINEDRRIEKVFSDLVILKHYQRIISFYIRTCTGFDLSCVSLYLILIYE